MSPSTLQISDYMCLSTVCGSHHLQFNAGYFVFVPSKSQREVLFDHEHRDFAYRESLITNGQPDPGRSLPNVRARVKYGLINLLMPISEDL